eukprot:1883901-Rhodomonas_salina.1
MLTHVHASPCRKFAVPSTGSHTCRGARARVRKRKRGCEVPTQVEEREVRGGSAVGGGGSV